MKLILKLLESSSKLTTYVMRNTLLSRSAQWSSFTPHLLRPRVGPGHPELPGRPRQLRRHPGPQDLPLRSECNYMCQVVSVPGTCHAGCAVQCLQAVGTCHSAVTCQECDTWHHLECLNPDIVESLMQTESWLCAACGETRHLNKLSKVMCIVFIACTRIHV